MATQAAVSIPDADDGPLGWIKQAACRDVPLAVFFAPPSDEVGVAYAKSFCAQCSVIGECLEFALRYERRTTPDEDMGIYGGLTYDERRSYARRRRTQRLEERRGQEC